MWERIAKFILRYRVALLIGLCVITVLQAYKAAKVEIGYEFLRMVPSDDSTYIEYQEFISNFGDDGAVFVIGIESTEEKRIFNHRVFKEWYRLGKRIEANDRVVGVLSMANLPKMTRNDSLRRFEIKPFISQPPANQAETDSLKKRLLAQPFYTNLLHNQIKEATMMAVTLDSAILENRERIEVVLEIEKMTEAFSNKTGLDVKHSGMPYARSVMSRVILEELNIFSLASVGITALMLLLFFRSAKSVIFPFVVIITIFIWTFGFMGWFDFKITLLTGLIPPLMVIIAVPNFIYFLNKYHAEYHKHGEKHMAIRRMIQRIGIVALLSNITTAIGFGVLAFTDSPVLREFGIVASVNIIATFFISIILIPVVFSFLPSPSRKQTKYLQSRGMNLFVDWLVRMVTYYRPSIYAGAALIITVAALGANQLRIESKALDDIPEDAALYKDLQFFERCFSGVVPLEIQIDTKKPRGLNKLRNLKAIEKIQDTIRSRTVFSEPVSIVNLFKYAHQTYMGGDSFYYKLPGRRTVSFMAPYLRNLRERDKNAALSARIRDTAAQKARIMLRMDDIGTIRLPNVFDSLKNDLRPILDSNNFEMTITGIGRLYLKNNEYLIRGLRNSLVLAFIIIGFLVALMFGRFRMILAALIPNMIPLLVTAGLMGWTGIPLKPSTVLVFSIAFGISIDDTLHYLARYRQVLANRSWDHLKVVQVALTETGYSMIYTSLVLFFGFGIFAGSDFGGTMYLGLLTSITLLVAMLTNLLVLPALILSLYGPEKRRSLRKT